jgi:hypothetical protein
VLLESYDSAVGDDDAVVIAMRDAAVQLVSSSLIVLRACSSEITPHQYLRCHSASFDHTTTSAMQAASNMNERSPSAHVAAAYITLSYVY